MSMLNGDEMDLTPKTLLNARYGKARHIFISKNPPYEVYECDIVSAYPAEFDPRPDLIHPFED